MKIMQITLALMTSCCFTLTANAEIGAFQSYEDNDAKGILFLSKSSVAVGVNGEFGNRAMSFSHLKANGADASGVYRFAGSDIPVATHKGLGVWDFKQVGSEELYFGEWAKEIKDSSGNYTKQADAASHNVFYIGANADSSITSTGSATYTVYGLNNGNYYAGHYNANFGTGQLTGSLSNGTDTFNIGSARINSDASISGDNASWSGASLSATGGQVNGRFFNGQQDLAGVAKFTDRSKDIAFGGSK